MRKIYQSAPDVPQAIANKAIDMIERHLASNGVRRAKDLPEESKVRLLRELDSFFRSELLPRKPSGRERDGEPACVWVSRGDGCPGGPVLRWLRRVLHWGNIEPEP